MSIIIAGTARIPVGTLDKILPAMTAMLEGSRAEDGCITYSYGADVAEPGLIRVFEVWRDHAALDAHKLTEHMKTWRAASAALGLHDRDLTVYDTSASRPL